MKTMKQGEIILIPKPGQAYCSVLGLCGCVEDIKSERKRITFSLPCMKHLLE